MSDPSVEGTQPSDLEVLTFGCRLNIYESEVVRRLADEAGLARAVIVNTCAVTGEAERQARQAIRRAHRRRPDAPILVTGCAAQLHPESFAALPGVVRVVGNAGKLDAASWAGKEIGAGKEAPSILVGDPGAAAETAAHLVDGFDGHARAFVQAQQGCDHRCTFCIIPFARGDSRSVPLGQLSTVVRRLVEGGYREIVLTGVDLTAYGLDLPGRPSLGQAVRRLLAAVPELERVRLSSLDPVEIDEDLWRLVAEESRLMPHLHLSVQAGSDLILKRMKRRHSRADVIAAAARLRALRPGMALGADLIAGFPTETEAQFEESCALVAEAGLDFLHVFPYSARPGTPAARMPAVPGEVVKARAARLRVLGETASERLARTQLGTEVSVLMERGGLGRTEHYIPLRPDRPVPVGSIFRARAVGYAAGRLSGEVL